MPQSRSLKSKVEPGLVSLTWVVLPNADIFVRMREFSSVILIRVQSSVVNFSAIHSLSERRSVSSPNCCSESLAGSPTAPPSALLESM